MLKTTTALFSSYLAFSILLLGVHAKDVSAMSLSNQAGAKKYDDASVGQKVQKIAERQVNDLHNHVEKQTYKSMVKTFSDQQPQADNRGLRKQRHMSERKLRLRSLLPFASI